MEQLIIKYQGKNYDSSRGQREQLTKKANLQLCFNFKKNARAFPKTKVKSHKTFLKIIS